MKTISNTLWCVLVLAVSAGATNYTVKSGGGGNFATIQACATAMSAGDTCTVYAGTYNENVTVTAGTSGQYKTLTVNSGDAVYVLSFTINSHVKIDGFHIQNPSSPSSQSCVSIIANSTDYYITNNQMYACGPYMIKEPASANTTHGFIQGNTLSYSCSTSASPNVCTAMQINGDYHLIENNDISHVSDGPYMYGTHNVFRKNTFHDISSADCGSNSGNCHVDLLQADSNYPAGNGSQYLLIESNTILNMTNTGSPAGEAMHAGPLLQAESCSGHCSYAIVRFNSAAHIGGGAITDDNSGASSPAWNNVKDYNNTWADMNVTVNGMGNGTNNFSYGSTGGSDINDLFYYTVSLPDFNPYITDATTVSNINAGHNLGYCTASPCQLRPKTYGTGSWTDDPGNIQTDPKFVNYAGNDFDLTQGSPAIGAGTFLTTVSTSDSGSGISLVVNDAGYFQDGAGITGVEADCISVAAVGKTVCIIAVNYSTNTLTLASSLTRSPGDPVWLYSDSTGRPVLVGTAPNIGAGFGSSSGPAVPTGLTALVN